MPKNTIMFTGGGTAGHLAPVLSVAAKIHALSPESKLVYIIERNNPNEQLIRDSNLPITVRHIFAGKYRRFHNQKLISKLFSFKNNLLNVRDLLYFGIGFAQSIWLMLRYRPSILFSKGGFVGAPVSLSAALLHIKFITHDSDSVPGISNRLAGRFATKNAVGVDGANYPYGAGKIVFTGVPVSHEYFDLSKTSTKTAKATLGIPEDSEMLFIGGSTQGARTIDDNVEKIVPKLLKDFPKLVVVHAFGRLNEESIKTRYRNLEPKYKSRLILKTFLPDLYNYAAASDIIITRAGATSLAGFGVLGKACIVIPAAHLVEGHQIENARGLAEQSAIIVVNEDRAGEELEKQVVYLLQHPEIRKSLGKKLNSITPDDAAGLIANLILKEI